MSGSAAKTMNPPQTQDHQPGRESEMHPKPDYMPKFPGNGRLKDKVAIITGGDTLCLDFMVLSPLGGRSLTPVDWGVHLATQVDGLRAGGSSVETVFPDGDSEHLFGAAAMDPTLRPPAARAGYEQGRARAEQLTGFWR